LKDGSELAEVTMGSRLFHVLVEQWNSGTDDDDDDDCDGRLWMMMYC